MWWRWVYSDVEEEEEGRMWLAREVRRLRALDMVKWSGAGEGVEDRYGRPLECGERWKTRMRGETR